MRRTYRLRASCGAVSRCDRQVVLSRVQSADNFSCDETACIAHNHDMHLVLSHVRQAVKSQDGKIERVCQSPSESSPTNKTVNLGNNDITSFARIDILMTHSQEGHDPIDVLHIPHLL